MKEKKGALGQGALLFCAVTGSGAGVRKSRNAEPLEIEVVEHFLVDVDRLVGGRLRLCERRLDETQHTGEERLGTRFLKGACASLNVEKRLDLRAKALVRDERVGELLEDHGRHALAGSTQRMARSPCTM